MASPDESGTHLGQLAGNRCPALTALPTSAHASFSASSPNNSTAHDMHLHTQAFWADRALCRVWASLLLPANLLGDCGKAEGDSASRTVLPGPNRFRWRKNWKPSLRLQHKFCYGAKCHPAHARSSIAQNPLAEAAASRLSAVWNK